MMNIVNIDTNEQIDDYLTLMYPIALTINKETFSIPRYSWSTYGERCN